MDYYDDGYMWPQEHTTFDPVAYQDSVSFSSYQPYDLVTYDPYTVYEFDEPKIMDHYHGSNDNGFSYDYDYDSGYGYNSYPSANPSINYFAHNYAEPKLIEYEPVKCETVYVSYHTNYSISNSKMDSGFNEPEFEEYDPTPYGGGYDIVSVYGKPLPPSDRTCYPRSSPKLNKPELVSQPVGPEPETKSGPKLEPEHETVHVPVLIPPPGPTPAKKRVTFVLPEPEPEPEPEPVPLSETLGLEDVGEREIEEYSYPVYGYDYPWPEYDGGNGSGVGYDYRYGKQVVQIPPCEYNPEVVDLCENMFGNWPCLARIRKQQMRMDSNPGIANCPESGHHNPWEDCANYFFGGPIASYNH